MASNSRKVLVCQHVPFEILGTLNPLLKAAGLRIRYINFARAPEQHVNLDGYVALIILGGPMSANDTARYPHLEDGIRLIREAIDRDLAVLGICLGAQLMARALGARVRENEGREIGWFDVTLTTAGRDDRLLCHLGSRERIFQWHADTFDIPPGAEHLARSENCPAQAFRYGQRAYGFQFHLEVDQPLIERWLTVPVHVRELAELGDRVDPDAIRRETTQRIAANRVLSERVFGEFIDLIGAPRRRTALPSR